jgi:hypothetical protein
MTCPFPGLPKSRGCFGNDVIIVHSLYNNQAIYSILYDIPNVYHGLCIDAYIFLIVQYFICFGYNEDNG